MGRRETITCEKQAERLFVVLALLLMAGEWIALIATRGAAWRTLIWNGNTAGIFPDLFQSIGDAIDLRPYSRSAIYPAFAYLLFYCLGQMIPGFVVGNWDAMSLTREGITVACFFFIVCIGLIAACVGHFWRRGAWTKGIFLAFFFCSAPFVFMIERGNTVILAMLFVFGFLAGYESESKLIRHLSFLCLACAASMKLYPAIFGLLMVNKKQIKEVPFLVLYGVAVFFLPFLLTGGVNSMVEMLEHAFTVGSQNLGNARGFGYGLKVNVQNAIIIFSEFTGVNISLIGSPVALICGLILAASGMLHRESWKRVTCISMILVLVPPFSWIYNGIYMLPAFTMFMNKSEPWKKKDLIYMLLFIFMFAPLPYGWICRSLEGANKVSFSTVTCFLSLCVMTVLLGLEVAARLRRIKANPEDKRIE